MSKIQTLRGMNDIHPKQVKEWSYVEEVIKSVVESYGYEEIRFPVVEKTELYTRSNEAADIVTKEMYTFNDKSGESISLRPEGTAGCVRAAIDNDLLRTDKPRLWYSGPMFRYERPQKGRSRQFHQFSAEVFGLSSPEIDAELIMMSARLWKELGIFEDLRLEINNLGDEKTRKSYSKALVDFLKKFNSDLDEEAKRKLTENPLRILDSKSPAIQEILQDAPLIEDFTNQDSKNYQAILLEILDEMGIGYKVNPRLVRGLDYYSHTTFEFITTRLGSQGTVLGGGRYDGLSEMLGGPSIPAVGFAAGVDRLVMLTANLEENSTILSILPVEEENFEYCYNLLNIFRENNIKCEIFKGGNLSKNLKKISKKNRKLVIIVGDEEIQNKQVILKDLSTGEQKKIQETDILEKINVSL